MEEKKGKAKREKKSKSTKFKIIRNIILVVIALAIILVILKVAPNYMKDEITDKTNLIINNGNITSSLKNDVIVKDGIIYLSQPDIDNFFDPYIYYDKKEKRIITTGDTKMASLILGQNKMEVNGSIININGIANIKDGVMYLPFSEMKEVYNIDIQYIEGTDIVTIDSLNREQVKAEIIKKASVKYRARTISRTVDKVDKGEKIIIISKNNGWVKVRTETGKIGYLKENTIANEIMVRQDFEREKQITGKVSMVWDNYSKYVSAPDRTGTQIDGVNVVSPAFFALDEQGNIIDKVGSAGQKYIQWAKDNNYKIWAMFANESMLEVTSEIMNSYELRQKTIDKIISLAVKYNIDGINLDFEYMRDADIDLFSQFVIELYPRLKEVGMVFSVDVTAPDGGENWSLCYDRNVIADNCDYIVFMAYDQYGSSSTKSGTTAGYDWIKVNLNKFIKTEDIDIDKIILGIPFYTRLWKESDGKVTNRTVNMKNVDSVLPKDVDRTWNDDLKQYYAEYQKSGDTYKMWIEDKESIQAKLSLITSNELGGAAFWEINRETSDVWPIIKETLGL